MLLAEATEGVRTGKESFRPYDEQVIYNRNKHLLSVIDQQNPGPGSETVKDTFARTSTLLKPRDDSPGSDEPVPESVKKIDGLGDYLSGLEHIKSVSRLRERGKTNLDADSTVNQSKYSSVIDVVDRSSPPRLNAVLGSQGDQHSIVIGKRSYASSMLQSKAISK